MKTHSSTGIGNVDELVGADGRSARCELDSVKKKTVWSQGGVVKL